MSVFEARLPELSESEARGDLAVIYGEIRSFARLPFVALLYRHLATRPGVLPWLWQALRPEFASGAIPDAASRLAEVARLPIVAPVRAAQWRMAGLTAEDRGSIAHVLDAYDRANPINLLVARLSVRLLVGGDVVAAPVTVSKPLDRANRPARPAIPRLPPLLPASAIPAEISTRLARLANFGQPAAGAMTPSLYRHLAHWPGYLALLPERLETAFLDGAVVRAVEAYRQAADAESIQLEPPACVALADRDRPSPQALGDLPATLEAFAALIPEMIAVGRLARAMLPREPI